MSFDVESFCPNCSKPRNDAGWSQCTCVLDGRIIELEKLVASKCECENAQTVVVQGERISTLEAALREIAEHPHLMDPAECLGVQSKKRGLSAARHALGCSDGHRCAAEIARKALEQK